MRLQTASLRVGYGGQAVLGPLTLGLQAGEFACLLGANGAGKSTLLRALCGMQQPLSGTIFVQGQALGALSAHQRARIIATVLTERLDDVHMTGRELASLGRYPHLDWLGRLDEDDHAIVAQAMKDADAGYLSDKRLDAMSDGERQKVLFARALAQQPQLLILDEATAFLDLPRRVQVMHWLKQLAREKNIAVLLSTHDLELALRYADSFWMIDANRSVHTGAPEDLVLAGHLQATFKREGLTFDLACGELRRDEMAPVAIRVEGSGLRHAWACRAVRRAGYAVSEQAELRVEVTAACYALHGAGRAQTFDTLRALVTALETRTPGLPHADDAIR